MMRDLKESCEKECAFKYVKNMFCYKLNALILKTLLSECKKIYLVPNNLNTEINHD